MAWIDQIEAVATAEADASRRQVVETINAKIDDDCGDLGKRRKSLEQAVAMYVREHSADVFPKDRKSAMFVHGDVKITSGKPRVVFAGGMKEADVVNAANESLGIVALVAKAIDVVKKRIPLATVFRVDVKINKAGLLDRHKVDREFVGELEQFGVSIETPEDAVKVNPKTDTAVVNSAKSR